MRRYRKMMLTALAGCLALGSAAPAAADGVSFSLGAGFTVGRASFHVAYASPQRGYAPYYYRTSTPLRYEGYRCSSSCRRDGRYWYHAPDCPLVGHHFLSYGHQGFLYAGPGYYPVGPPSGYHSQGYSRHYRSGREVYGQGHRARQYGYQRHGLGYGQSKKHGYSKRSKKHGYSKRGHAPKH